GDFSFRPPVEGAYAYQACLRVRTGDKTPSPADVRCYSEGHKALFARPPISKDARMRRYAKVLDHLGLPKFPKLQAATSLHEHLTRKQMIPSPSQAKQYESDDASPPSNRTCCSPPTSHSPLHSPQTSTCTPSYSSEARKEW